MPQICCLGNDSLTHDQIFLKWLVVVAHLIVQRQLCLHFESSAFSDLPCFPQGLLLCCNLYQGVIWILLKNGPDALVNDDTALHILGNDPVDLINAPINFHSDYTVFLKDDGIVIRCACTERNQVGVAQYKVLLLLLIVFNPTGFFN